MKVKVLNAQTQLEIREIDLPETVAKHGECLFGRSPNSALVLDSPDVSRMHGKFLLEQGQYYFYDLGSANGSTLNGQLTQANHRYSLKSGDIIRVGEFVLLLHEVMLEELPATVIGGDPNATFVNDAQFNRIMSLVQEAPPAPVVEPPSVEPVEEVIAPLAPPAVEEPEELQDEVVASEEELSLVEDDSNLEIEEEEAISESDAVEPESVSEAEADDLIESNLEEITAELDIEEPEIDADSTVIQSEDEVIADEAPSSESPAIEDELYPSTEVADVAEIQITPEETPLAVEEDPWDDSVSIAQSAIAPEQAEPEVLTIEGSSTVSEELELPEPPAIELEEDTTVIQDSELVEPPDVELEEDTTVAQSSELVESPDVELEESSDVTVVPISEPEEQAAQSEAQTSKIEEPVTPIAIEEPVTPEVEEPEPPEPTISDSSGTPTPSIQRSEIISTKYVALLAHDSQIEALSQLVNRYPDLLNHCKTIATPTISEALLTASGISVSQQTPAVSAGGYQTLNGLITSDQVLAVIFLRDFLSPQPTQANDEALSRSCNVYRVLFATNTLTAEAVLHYIQTVVATA